MLSMLHVYMYVDHYYIEMAMTSQSSVSCIKVYSRTNTKLFANIHTVHGGWSTWTGWGSCSKTCGMGLQTKTRTCSNPLPARFGDHCFGESMEYQACFKRACTGIYVL